MKQQALPWRMTQMPIINPRRFNPQIAALVHLLITPLLKNSLGAKVFSVLTPCPGGFELRPRVATKVRRMTYEKMGIKKKASTEGGKY